MKPTGNSALRRPIPTFSHKITPANRRDAATDRTREPRQAMPQLQRKKKPLRPPQAQPRQPGLEFKMQPRPEAWINNALLEADADTGGI